MEKAGSELMEGEVTLDEQQAICDAASPAERYQPEFRDCAFWKRDKETLEDLRVLVDDAVELALHWNDNDEQFLQANWPQLPEPDGRGDLMVQDALFIWKARTQWPALIAEHRKALAEVADVRGEIEDALGAAGVWGNVDCEARTYTEAIEVLTGEIERLKGDNARLSLTTGAVGDQLAAGLLERVMAEIERLKAAGRKVVLGAQPDCFGKAREEWREACSVFEDGANAS